MRAVFDKGELLVLLRDFYELTGLRTVVFDEWGMDILSYPQQLPDYCRLVRATPQGEMGCRLCDQKACRQARQEKTTWIYPCHAGLIEAITPIQIDGVVVGYLLLSHIVQGADEQAEWQRAWQLCAGYPIRQEELYRAYRQLPRTPYQRLRAACDLLALSARALCQVHMARLVPGSPAETLNRFLADHLAEDLSSDRICAALGMGRTALYQLSKERHQRVGPPAAHPARHPPADHHPADQQPDLPADRHCGLQLLFPRLPPPDRLYAPGLPPPVLRHRLTGHFCSYHTPAAPCPYSDRCSDCWIFVRKSLSAQQKPPAGWPGGFAVHWQLSQQGRCSTISSSRTGG